VPLVTTAFSSLKPHWPVSPAELDKLSYKTKIQLGKASKRFGNPIGTDFIKSQKAGDSFLKHTYIVKYERTSIRYICVFSNNRLQTKEFMTSHYLTAHVLI